MSAPMPLTCSATVASGEVRGGAPGTREFDLLAPERLVDRVDAGQEAGGRLVGEARAHPRVGEARDDREVLTEILQDVQVRRERDHA